MPRFNIRRLERSDVAAFRDIRLEGLERHPEAFGASYEDELAHSASQISDRIANNSIFGGFTDADALVGVIAIARMKGAKTQHIASIWGMYTRPEARGSGLSRQLMHAALDEATHAGRYVFALFHPTMPPSASTKASGSRNGRGTARR